MEEQTVNVTEQTGGLSSAFPFETSAQINELTKALAEAQGELRDALKDEKNPYYNSKYADLTSILQVVRPVFSKYGLSIIQMPFGVIGDACRVLTQLSHSSGQFIREVFSVPAVNYGKDGKIKTVDPQVVLSSTTYARRGALAAICGVGQEDDDGNRASGIDTKQSPKDPSKAELPPIDKLLDKASAYIEEERTQNTVSNPLEAEAKALKGKALANFGKVKVLDTDGKEMKPESFYNTFMNAFFGVDDSRKRPRDLQQYIAPLKWLVQVAPSPEESMVEAAMACKAAIKRMSEAA